MEWWLILPIIFGSLVILMLAGMPVAFSFMLINLVGVFVFWGGVPGLRQLILSIFESVTFFAMLPVPLFILMGEVLFRSGMGTRMLDALERLLGRLPGRLSLVAVGGGVLIGVLSGNSWASAAMLGSVLAPEMERRGYKKPMTLGPIMGSGVLAIIIPPSGMAVVLASLAAISVGGLLIAGVIPGLIMAVFFTIYIIGRCILQPDIAPAYAVARLSLWERLRPAIRNVLPLGVIVFSVIGTMLMGVATPSEAAAFGALSTFVLAAAYRSLNWQAVKTAFSGTLNTTVMIFMIFCGATAFSQILAYSGATRGMVELGVTLPVSPIILLIGTQLIVVFMGMFMEQMSILMITLPIFMPLCAILGWNPLWFGLMMLINMGIANLTPPFGVLLFVMKGVSPPDTTMGDIYRAAIPFVIMDFIVILLVMAFPPIATWLPSIL